MQYQTLPYRHIALRFMPPEGNTPYFIGSQIRGALGYALKETVCINPSYRCEGCFAKENCLYFDWFEKKGSYHPYRLDIELGKPYYNAGLYLFSDAVEKLPYVVSALHRMLTKNGLGVKRTKIETFELIIDGKKAYDGKKFVLPENEPQIVREVCENPPERIKVSFITPLRIKYQNRFVRTIEELHFPTLIHSAYRRFKELTRQEAGKLPFRVEGDITDRFGTFEDLTRYSSRQKGKLKIGGLRGEIVIEGPDARSYAYLKAAEIIGAGKQTVFGLGKIKVDAI
jgi:CRISPR-associated endoribonuclease Cas6